MSAYPHEVAYDFRNKLHVSYDDPSLTNREFILLFESLLNSTDSKLYAAMNGIHHAFDSDTLILYDLYDAFIAANSDPKKKKMQPHTRPFDKVDEILSLEGEIVEQMSEGDSERFTRLMEMKKQQYGYLNNQIESLKVEEKINLFELDDKNNENNVISLSEWSLIE